MGQQVELLRIAVASPSDVQEEREKLEHVIAELNRGIAANLNYQLRLIKWETDAYPGFHKDGGQALVDKALKIDEADVFIGIFWKRFGTPVKDSDSGTEHEFQQAYQSWKETDSPHIMFYFNQKPYFPASAGEIEQLSSILAFKEGIRGEGLYQDYNGTDDFIARVREHLHGFLVGYYEQQNNPEETEEFEDEEAENDEESETEAICLRNETVVVRAGEFESFEFNLEAEVVLQIKIRSDQPINIYVIKFEELENWENNEDVDILEHYKERKKSKLLFQPQSADDYSLIIDNKNFFTSAEVRVRVLLLTN